MFDDVQPQNLVLGEDSAHPTKSMHEVIYQAREDVKVIASGKTSPGNSCGWGKGSPVHSWPAGHLFSALESRLRKQRLEQ